MHNSSPAPAPPALRMFPTLTNPFPSVICFKFVVCCLSESEVILVVYVRVLIWI